MKIVATYDYTGADGTLLYQVVRYEPKSFCQRHKDAAGNWQWNLDGVTRTLYRLPEFLESSMADWVFVAEGEKDVDRLWKEGLPATTSGGATTWQKGFAQYFRGRLACILPDNDEPGRTYAQTVAACLSGVAGQVRILHLPFLDPGGDVSDWFDAGATTGELLALLETAARVDCEPPAAPLPPPQEPSAEPEESQPRPVLVRLSTVTPRPLEWLWPDRLPLGKLSLLAGDPGLGKSYLTLYLAAQVSRGRAWPDDTTGWPGIPGSVVLLSAEDDAADTMQPRLVAHAADLEKIIAIQAVVYSDEAAAPYRFSLSTHLPALEEAIAYAGDTRLVIIDPISAYLGKTDSHKNADVRALLAPLATIASKHRVAIVAVSHLNKSDSTPAIYRTMGSLAFTAAARAVWLVSKDPHNSERRLLTPAKANLARDVGGLAFSIQDGKVVFESGTLDLTSDEALAKPDAGPKQDRCEAKAFLLSRLEAGPCPSSGVMEAARNSGFSSATIRRAKEELGIASFQQLDRWFWKLP